MPEEDRDEIRQADLGWLEGHTPASVPYIIGFSIFVPTILGFNIGLEFWLAGGGNWVAVARQGLLNAGTMSTWGIPLTIVSTEGITKMLARHYVARKEREKQSELATWHREQITKWKDRKRQAEVEGRDFIEPRPEPPPGINSNERDS